MNKYFHLCNGGYHFKYGQNGDIYGLEIGYDYMGNSTAILMAEMTPAQLKELGEAMIVAALSLEKKDE